jgi:hypothetical protein
MNPSRSAENPFRRTSADPDGARTESVSESSGEEEVPIRLLDRSSLDLAVKHWDAELETFGATARAEPNAESFSRFLWRLDVAIDLSGRDARLSVAPWLRTLAGNQNARRECFRLAAEEEEGTGQRKIVEIYEEMRGMR